jgi:plasmid stability protein
MSSIVVSDLAAPLVDRLTERARAHGRTPEAEAKVILEAALQPPATDIWAEVDEIYNELAATGRLFSDSVELLREDRER